MSKKQFITSDGQKCCTVCKEWKPLESFMSDKRTTSGKSSRCSTCHYKINRSRLAIDKDFRDNVNRLNRISKIKNKYGLSQESYNNLIINQNNKCAICSIEFNSISKKTKIAIDHCHKTDSIRGLLCSRCNIGLGQFRDNENYLLSAIQYLRKNK